MSEWAKEDHYIQQFRNRSKGKSRSPQSHLGNGTSCAGSRPSGHVKCSRRINEKMVNNDTELHHTVDHHQAQTPYLYRKSSIQTIVSHNPKPSVNQQKHVSQSRQRSLVWEKLRTICI